MMKLTVDLDADALYLNLGEKKAVESEEVAPGIILDYGSDDRVIGIEVLRLSKPPARLESGCQDC